MVQSTEFKSKYKREMRVDRRACMWCGACVGICPKNAITLHETRIEFYDECNLCRMCVPSCPVGAIEMVKLDGEGAGGSAPRPGGEVSA
jgi:ferredoxin